ncbi:MAG: peptide chain release factor N(5)-glutamine methyltransferase [Planctomycetia bacterium]|nr:peptide chain release factor N(5)-glutamine methyltransferase [Planctomycetia bacterium]
MPETEVWTIGRLLTWTAGYLKDRGADSPRLDAELLLAEARGCQRIDLYTAFDEVASDPTRVAFRELVRRRAEGTPVAYLVGRREFYAMSFRVTPDVLIPRPETEFVVVALLDQIKRRVAEPADAPLQIADVGTGSGILAVCAARLAPGSQVTAVDISPGALAVARQNATTHGVLDRIDFIESDLFAAVPEDRRFHFVLSNPPYITTAEMDSLSADVREYEPRMALLAGDRGTEVIERLIPQTVDRLLPGGWLIMEISPMIATAVEELLAATPELELGPTIKDLAGHARVVQARRAS